MATQAGGSENLERLQSSATDSKTESWSITDTCAGLKLPWNSWAHPIKAINAISLNNISSKKQVLGNSLNLVGILTWMQRDFWFCPLQLQLYNLGSQHLKKSHKQENSFQQKKKSQCRIKWSFIHINLTLFLLWYRSKTMQSTVFMLWVIRPKQNTSYCLTCKRELTCGEGNNEKAKHPNPPGSSYHLFLWTENKKVLEMESDYFYLHYS